LTTKLDHFWAVKPQWRLNPMNEAAYVEVTVIMLKIALLTCGQPIKPHLEEDIFRRTNMLLQTGHVSLGERSRGTIKPTFHEECCALLVRAVSIRALYTTTATRQMDQLQELIMSVIQYDVDIACGVLDHMSVIWNSKTSQAEDLAKLVDIYLGAYSATSSNNIRTSALRNLADVFEYLFLFGWLKRTEITSNKFRVFGFPFLMKGCPDLSNAEIRITGSLLAIDFFHHEEQGSLEEIAERIQAWGSMLSDNGRSENVSMISLLK
jgi:hypothetical protein